MVHCQAIPCRMVHCGAILCRVVPCADWHAHRMLEAFATFSFWNHRRFGRSATNFEYELISSHVQSVFGHIQFYSLIFGYIQSYSVLFSSIQFYLAISNSIRPYSTLFSHIHSYSTLFMASTARESKRVQLAKQCEKRAQFARARMASNAFEYTLLQILWTLKGRVNSRHLGRLF